ncbi:uncharacterized abhydrolase domain-containing protein DDB_G0269086-like isoform X2 [Siniperca chuatsi]|nr:uncharacterized abhydrolase domain-containing protein DDB_G0269086-like isoform X2 [Siniperca chuatsi]
MEKLRAKHLHMDLCNIYQSEIRVLSRDMEALQLENQELKHEYEALISAETKDREAMLLEIEELKNELQGAEASNNHEMSREMVASPFTVEQQLEEAKRKHSAEKQMLVTELTAAKQELEDLNQQLKTEKHLRMQVEAEKLEAVEIAETLFHKLEDMQRVLEERSAESWLLSAELKSEKTKQDQLAHEILELQQKLQKEQDLRNQAEAENFKDFEMEVSVCKEFDRQLQKEKKLRAEAEQSKLEALFQRLEEARTLTEEVSAGSQMLADRLQKEEKKQDALVGDIVELTQMLDKEMALRIQAENYELEAVGIVEALRKRIERCRRRSSARARTYCCNRKSFSLCFRNRGRRRAAHQHRSALS